MKSALLFARYLLAAVLGLLGALATLYMYFTQGDTGGALAVLAGSGLVCSMLINE
jgi:hypothetical protein